MEPKKPRQPGEATPENTENMQRMLGAQGDESTAESFDQTNLERPAEFGLILPNNPGPIARALRDDPELSRAESPGEPTVPRPDVADPTELAATSDPLNEVGLSPAESEKLVQQVIDAPTQQMSAGAESPDQLAGFIFRPIEGEGSKSSNAESASTRPRVDD